MLSAPPIAMPSVLALTVTRPTSVRRSVRSRRAMVLSAASVPQGNSVKRTLTPVRCGSPHEDTFTVDIVGGQSEPIGFYMEGWGMDGPPGQTGPGSGAIYVDPFVP